MKALLFMPFAFAAGAEGFALFAPYLVGVMAVLYLARLRRPAPSAKIAAPTYQPQHDFGVLGDLQPAM